MKAQKEMEALDKMSYKIISDYYPTLENSIIKGTKGYVMRNNTFIPIFS